MCSRMCVCIYICGSPCDFHGFVVRGARSAGVGALSWFLLADARLRLRLRLASAQTQIYQIIYRGQIEKSLMFLYPWTMICQCPGGPDFWLLYSTSTCWIDWSRLPLRAPIDKAWKTHKTRREILCMKKESRRLPLFGSTPRHRNPPGRLWAITNPWKSVGKDHGAPVKPARRGTLDLPRAHPDSDSDLDSFYYLTS